jgi:tetracycline 7-halogenase / FADH2 O2-dependent halogenase
VRATVAILGSGFAGSILARVLARQGHRVFLLERGRHPRFAIGESSTPLAALALERLAARYGLADLDSLAAYGRWRRDLPHLRRGLKRGFTFYAHAPRAPFANSERDEHRLLVAASPNDEVADTHWLRADVDQHLARAAADAGAELLEETAVTDVAARPAGGFRLELRDAAGSLRALDATHVVDGTGRQGVLGRRIAAARRIPTALDTTLLAAHLEGVVPFDEVARAGGTTLEPGPYPDHRAAVHHLLRDAWVYVLPFDHGVASIGIVAAGASAAGAQEDPEAAFHRALAVYPTLAASLEGARAVVPFQCSYPLAHRCHRAAGDAWALLPHTYAFYDPLFSAGIAWSLLAVERLADWGEALRDAAPAGAERLLARYGRLLAREADHVEALLVAAWRAMPDFDRFVAQTFLYFAAASFSEARQRLVPERAPDGGWAWSGFLGATDRVVAAWPRSMERIARDAGAAASGAGAAHRGIGDPASDFDDAASGVVDSSRYGPALDQVLALIAPRNVAGLGDPAFGRRVPVALEPLYAGARKLGLSRRETQARASRLRGWTGPPGTETGHG